MCGYTGSLVPKLGVEAWERGYTLGLGTVGRAKVPGTLPHVSS